jgi:hypothetical protein
MQGIDMVMDAVEMGLETVKEHLETGRLRALNSLSQRERAREREMEREREIVCTQREGEWGLIEGEECIILDDGGGEVERKEEEREGKEERKGGKGALQMRV